MTFVKVFRSDGTDTSISLQHQLAWSLITISGLFADSSLSICICISQRIVTFFFLVTVLGLCSFHLSGTSILPSSGYSCMQLPYCASLSGQFLQVWDSQT